MNQEIIFPETFIEKPADEGYCHTCLHLFEKDEIWESFCGEMVRCGTTRACPWWISKLEFQGMKEGV